MNPKIGNPSIAEIDYLEQKDFIYLGGWLFFKGGKVYDLSAADLKQLDKIVSEDLFVVAA